MILKSKSFPSLSVGVTMAIVPKVCKEPINYYWICRYIYLMEIKYDD